MRVVVISCWKYRDAWAPFFELLRNFWPNCPYRRVLLTDYIDGSIWPIVPKGSKFDIYAADGNKSWCGMLAEAAGQYSDKPILLMQEDFFLNAPVRQDIIERAVELVEQGAGCVRLYPCPGSDVESLDPYFGGISHQADYRISCQAAVWSPCYLRLIAEHAAGSPADFEIKGTELSRGLLSPLYAFKRHVEPWPLSYLCSAIGRGLWSQDAKKLCDQQNIDVDWSLRGFQRPPD